MWLTVLTYLLTRHIRKSLPMFGTVYSVYCTVRRKKNGKWYSYGLFFVQDCISCYETFSLATGKFSNIIMYFAKQLVNIWFILDTSKCRTHQLPQKQITNFKKFFVHRDFPPLKNNSYKFGCVVSGQSVAYKCWPNQLPQKQIRDF